jgi:uncharacterized membrane protein
MRGLVLVGVVLVFLGVATLVLPAITYTKTEKIVEFGPLQVTKEDKKSIPLPPIAGGAAVIAGIVMVIAGTRRDAV